MRIALLVDECIVAIAGTAVDDLVGGAAVLGGIDVVVARAAEELVAAAVEQRSEAVAAALSSQHIVAGVAHQLVVAAAAGDGVIAAAAVGLDAGLHHASDSNRVRSLLRVDNDQGVGRGEAAAASFARKLTSCDSDPRRIADDVRA